MRTWEQGTYTFCYNITVHANLVDLSIVTWGSFTFIQGRESVTRWHKSDYLLWSEHTLREVFYSFCSRKKIPFHYNIVHCVALGLVSRGHTPFCKRRGVATRDYAWTWAINLPSTSRLHDSAPRRCLTPSIVWIFKLGNSCWVGWMTDFSLVLTPRAPRERVGSGDETSDASLAERQT